MFDIQQKDPIYIIRNIEGIKNTNYFFYIILKNFKHKNHQELVWPQDNDEIFRYQFL